MFLLVGLGNPGKEYEQTRHNAGFIVADHIIREYSLDGPKDKYQGELYQGDIAGYKVYLIKPMTYMNKSGSSVAQAANFFKIPPENVIVFYDEIDLAHHKVRVKLGGGAGGHNGIKSIDSHLGNNYWRVRLGIDHPGDKERVTGHVLGKFTTKEAQHMEKVSVSVSRHLPLMLSGDHEAYMSKVAHDLQPPKPKKEKPQEESVE